MKRKWEIEDEKKEVSDRSDSDEKGNVIYTIHIEKLEEKWKMDKSEAVGVLKTLQDLNDSNYIKGALELSIKSLQSAESSQMDSTFIERSLLMVTIEHVRDICDKLNGNCHSCPFGSKDGCPFLSDDPMDWNVEYINERYSNSPLSKEDSGCLQL